MVQGAPWAGGLTEPRQGPEPRLSSTVPRGSRVSLYRWSRMGWHSRNAPSTHHTSIALVLSHCHSNPSPLLCSCVSAALTSLLFQRPQELQVFRSQKHSVLIPYFLWKAIFTCKPEILVSRLYSAKLMRTRSIHEKYLLSKFIIIFQTQVYWIPAFFLPVPIYCPFHELSV